MCMFILWLSIVTLHMNPLPQSLQWNLLSESAMCTPCIWCFTFFTTDQAAILFTGQPSFVLHPDVPLFVLPVNVALSHLTQSCSDPWHIRALTVPRLHLVPELVLFQLCLACVPILSFVREFLPTVWTEEFLSSRLAVLLPLLLLVVLINVFNNLFL